MKYITFISSLLLILAFLGSILFLISVKEGGLQMGGDELGGAYLDRELRANEINNINTKLDSMKLTYGEYTQVTLDGRILISNGEVVDQQLIDLLPSNFIVNVYSGPSGDGFELIQTLSDREVHYGFGGEAIERTYTVVFPTIIASTTP